LLGFDGVLPTGERQRLLLDMLVIAEEFPAVFAVDGLLNQQLDALVIVEEFPAQSSVDGLWHQLLVVCQERIDPLQTKILHRLNIGNFEAVEAILSDFDKLCFDKLLTTKRKIKSMMLKHIFYLEFSHRLVDRAYSVGIV